MQNCTFKTGVKKFQKNLNPKIRMQSQDYNFFLFSDKKQGRLLRKIKYPLFNECMNRCDSVFWKTFFKNLSFGKIPKGFVLRENTIYVTGLRKFLIINENPDVCTEEIIEFMKDCGYISEEEKLLLQKRYIEEMTESSSTSNCSWSSITSKKMKDIHINNFIYRISEAYNLTSKQRNELMVILKIGFSLGNITNDDIIFSEGRIVNINGIEFNDGRFIIQRQATKKLKIKYYTDNQPRRKS